MTEQHPLSLRDQATEFLLGERQREATVSVLETVQHEGARQVARKLEGFVEFVKFNRQQRIEWEFAFGVKKC